MSALSSTETKTRSTVLFDVEWGNNGAKIDARISYAYNTSGEVLAITRLEDDETGENLLDTYRDQAMGLANEDMVSWT